MCWQVLRNPPELILPAAPLKSSAEAFDGAVATDEAISVKGTAAIEEAGRGLLLRKLVHFQLLN